MSLQANIIFNVPDLPDADVWFLNAAAWKNYWKLVDATFELDAAPTTVYVPSAYDNTLQPAVYTVDAVNYVLATNDMFNSLLAKVNALDASYQALRTQLLDAGFIDNAQ